MIIDCHSKEYKEYPYPSRILVDGIEINKVFYADTDQGFVKTYDVIEDGEIRASRALSSELYERGLREGWDMPPDGIVSKVVLGKVELIPK